MTLHRLARRGSFITIRIRCGHTGGILQYNSPAPLFQFYQQNPVTVLPFHRKPLIHSCNDFPDGTAMKAPGSSPRAVRKVWNSF